MHLECYANHQCRREPNLNSTKSRTDYLNNREALDLGVDQVQRSRNRCKASEGVALSDGNNILRKDEVALNSLEVGLKEEGGGEEGVVYLQRGAVKESCNALGGCERNNNVGRSSRSIVGELDGGGGCRSNGSEESNRESGDELHFDGCVLVGRSEKIK
jgi:hypothetical protein